MTTYSAREILQHQFKGQPNFMTPTRIKSGKIDAALAYELNSGRGIYDEPIFGISIVEVVGTDPLETRVNTELGELFHSRSQAENHITYLKDTAPVMHREPLP